MASAKLLQYQRAAAKIPTRRKGRDYIMSIMSDAELTFARTQSQEFQNMEWESRLQPLRPWCQEFIAGLLLVFFIIMCAIFPW